MQEELAVQTILRDGVLVSSLEPPRQKGVQDSFDTHDLHAGAVIMAQLHCISSFDG